MRSGILYFALVLFGAAAVGLAQTRDHQARFEVASVKIDKSGAFSFKLTPGRITTIISMQGLIQYAFGAPQYQLAGLPTWAESEKYSIVATMPADTNNTTLRLMMQDLLQTRFHFLAHREKKELPVYVLLLARNGPKFQIEKRQKKDGDGQVGGGGRGRLGGIKVSAFDLAESLAAELGRPVLDQTGIDGLFDFRLVWTPDETQRATTELSPNERSATVDPNGASIFAAVQEQLGLRLAPQRGQVGVWVIDHIDQLPN